MSLGIALPSFTLPQTTNILNIGLLNPLLTWLDSFHFPSIAIFSQEQSSQNKPLNEKLKISLTESEYSDLMKHIESYVENMLNEKYQRENLNINSQINEKIADALGNSIKMYKYELNDLEINMIAGKVKDSLKDILVENSNKPILLSTDNIEQITNLINNHLHLEQNQFIIDEQQMKDILLTVLSSEKLIEVIDLRILEKLKQTQSAFEDQKILIENVRKELGNVQARFDERMESSNLLLKDDLNFLKANQEKLADQIFNYQIENAEKYQKFTNDMEINLFNWKEQQTAEINNIVKANVLAVLAEKNLSDENLKAWVQNVFVAKDYLETKLNELNLNMNKVTNENINSLGTVLMKDIAAQLKSDMLVAINEKTAKQNGNVAIGVGIDEIDVKRIVREALAIYDADKTGLVDYALESAGGQILSTRLVRIIILYHLYSSLSLLRNYDLSFFIVITNAHSIKFA